jgi:hypothetical protein
MARALSQHNFFAPSANAGGVLFHGSSCDLPISAELRYAAHTFPFPFKALSLVFKPVATTS